MSRLGVKRDRPYSGRCLQPRVSPDYLPRLSEGAQEGSAHAVAIGKTRAMTSIGWRLCSIISRAVSTPRFSTALAGDWPVSARNARLNWRGLS